jgi:hypothetical protein
MTAGGPGAGDGRVGGVLLPGDGCPPTPANGEATGPPDEPGVAAASAGLADGIATPDTGPSRTAALPSWSTFVPSNAAARTTDTAMGRRAIEGRGYLCGRTAEGRVVKGARGS